MCACLAVMFRYSGCTPVASNWDPCHIWTCQSTLRSMFDMCQEEIAAVEPVPVYSVNPDKMTIAAKSSCQLEFSGFSAQPGQLDEHFLCSLAGGTKTKHVVFDTTARCVVLAFRPHLQVYNPICPARFSPTLAAHMQPEKFLHTLQLSQNSLHAARDSSCCIA